MRCSSLNLKTLNIYFRMNQNNKVLVDFSFDYRMINPKFFEALEELIGYMAGLTSYDLEQALNQFPTGDQLRLIVIHNDNERRLALT